MALYDTVHIGNQVWLKQNLKTKHYSNGDLIPNVSDSAQWLGLTTGARCNYNNDSINIAENGSLYNFYVTTDIRNVCPGGWHVPLNNEWNTLINFTGGDLVAGGKLKEAGLLNWFSI